MSLQKPRALFSVSDKSGAVSFARILVSFGYEILSTGGTATELRKHDVPVTDVSDYTGFPEMMDGRVKTLHPKVHGGLLQVRGNPEHEAKALEHGIGTIDMVVVNLYPFEKTVAKAGTTIPEAIEQIDIGGPSMVRSGSKNHASVTVVVDPADYQSVIDDLEGNVGKTTLALRERLAAKAFDTTSRYDTAISAYLHANLPGAQQAQSVTKQADLFDPRPAVMLAPFPKSSSTNS